MLNLLLLLMLQTDHESRIRRLEAIEGINVCGNGVFEPDFAESCDVADLGGQTCQAQGFDGGTLACSVSCAFDASACFNDVCPNLDGVQLTVPSGYHMDGGQCVLDAPPFTLATAKWVALGDSSKMRSVYDPAIDDQWQIRLGKWPNAFEHVQAAWSGAVCAQDRLYILGGGHNDSPHNGVFSVDPQTGEWRRESLPSPWIWGLDPQAPLASMPTGCTGASSGGVGICGQMSDGAMASRHTYYYLASDGAAIYMGGGGMFPGGSPSAPPTEWRFDLATKTWTSSVANGIEKGHGHMRYYQGRLWMTTAAGYRVLDLASGAWSDPGAPRVSGYGGQTSSVTAGDKVIWFGNTYANVMEMAQFGHAQAALVGAPPDFQAATYLGATYYAPEGTALYWKGGGQIAALDVAARTWQVLDLPGDVPGPPTSTGTMGRFSYCGGRVVLVNGVDAPLYYLDSATAPPPPPPPPDPMCGDGSLDSGEQCDGANLGGATCVSRGFVGGNLSCTGDCAFDTSGCDTAPPPPPPPAAGANPYYATPPGDSIIVRDCGSMPDSWPFFDVRTDADLLAAKTWATKNPRGRLRIHPTPLGLMPLSVKGATCLQVEGVLGPNGERPLIAAVNGTRSFHEGEPIRPGGLIIQDLEISPGKMVNLRGGDTTGLNIDAGIGIPGDQTFVIVRRTEVSRTGHHSFITPPSSHQLYLELDRVDFSMADSHLAYIDGIAMAYVHDSKFHSPGWGHALRCVARRCVIENVEVSNVGLDGTVEVNDNPLSPNSKYIGMHPFDLYACGEHTVKDLKIVLYAAEGHNGFFAGNLARGRQDIRNCDIGEVQNGEWTSLVPTTPEFLDPARWATATDLVTEMDGVTVHCVGPDAARCYAFDIDTSYPILNVGEFATFQAWLKAGQFPTLAAMQAAIPPEHPEWLWPSQHLATSSVVSFLKGSVVSNVPIATPPTWFQRTRVRLRNIMSDAPKGLIRPTDLPGYFCYGAPNEPCTDQIDGRSYRRAFIETP